MKKYIVEEIRIGESEGGIACGPCGGYGVAEARISTEEGNTVFYGLVDVDGCFEFYKTDESRIEKEVTEDYAEGEEFPEYKGFYDTYEFYEEVNEAEEDDKAEALVLKMLVFLLQSNSDKSAKLIKNFTGKAIGSVDIPICDAEKEYLAEIEEEEDTEDEESVITVVSKRVMSSSDERFNQEESSYWLSGIDFCDAEVAFKDDMKEYFALVWSCSEEPEEVSAIITDESIYNLDEQFFADESLGDELKAKIEEIKKRNSAESLGYNLAEKYIDQIMEAKELLADFADLDSEEIEINIEN